MSRREWRNHVRSGVLALSPRLWDWIRHVRRSALNRRSPEKVFRAIYRKNAWQGSDSASGPGSSHANTEKVRESLPDLLRRYNVRSLLDIPCGDAAWIGECLPSSLSYTGADIVPDLIEKNRRTKAELGDFIVRDLTKAALPKADMVLVRDCLIHLPDALIKRALRNIKESGAHLLLTTTYTGVETNQDIELGGWRPINLTKAPFELEEPIELITENEAANGGHGKSLGLWSVADLP